MSQKNLFTLAIVVAFLFGIGTMLLLQKNLIGGNSFKANLTATTSSEQTMQCAEHEDCETGSVCRLGTCVKAELAFCSQSFMLAESVENRFIRYTPCPQRCVSSGERSAYCE